MTIRKGEYIARGNQIHPGKPCGPCCLCLWDQPSYTHVVSMQQEQWLWLLKYEQPDPADCICRRCAENVRKRMGEDLYVPVWKKSVEVRQSCLVVTCENEGTKGCAFIPYSVISEVLECNMHQDAPKTLCDGHYKLSIMFGQHPTDRLAHHVADVQMDMSDLLANVLTQN